MAPRFQRILVAGGDGFIGRHLCRALMERGIEVIVVDDHSTSCAAPSSLWQTIEQDVSALSLAGLPRVDAVMHLASPAAPHLFGKDPLAGWSCVWKRSAGRLVLARGLSVPERYASVVTCRLAVLWFVPARPRERTLGHRLMLSC